jgi:hypothetical protein
VYSTRNDVGDFHYDAIIEPAMFYKWIVLVIFVMFQPVILSVIIVLMFLNRSGASLVMNDHVLYHFEVKVIAQNVTFVINWLSHLVARQLIA